MGSCSEIVEISSGEEDNSNKLNGSLGRISGILDEGLDDLIVMDELSTPPKKKTSDGKYGGYDDATGRDDDDDCQVLDSDPDKPASVVDGSKEASDGSDEIEIVGEKGQIACRDFPHARHLCANFPFNTGPHDEHCIMCHCYVCDSPAPCAFWGNSASTNSNSHCHATDKNPIWKKLRDSRKLSSKVSSLFKPNFPNPTSRVTPWQPVTQNKSNMPNLNPNHHPNPRVIPSPLPTQAQKTRMNIVRPCLTSHSHRVGPYHPSRSRHLSRTSSMQVHSSNHGLPGYPVLSPTQTNSCPILNQSHSTSETLLRMCQRPAVFNSLRTSQSQSGESTQIPAQTPSNMQEKLDDVYTKSWQDILASVASELGVPDYCADNASLVPQSISSTYQPVTSVNQEVNQFGDGKLNGTGFDNNVTGTHGDVGLGEMNVNSQAGVELSGVSVSSNPFYDLKGNWGDSAPI